MSYTHINKAFEIAVTHLQNNLQYLANKGKVSPKFIAIQNKIIKTLIDYQQSAELHISNLEMLNAELLLSKRKEYQDLKDDKEALEAICIIHGVLDFPLWLSRGKDYLVYEAITFHKNKEIKLPIQLREYLDTLSKSEFNQIRTILNKKQVAQLENKIQALKQQYGIET